MWRSRMRRRRWIAAALLATVLLALWTDAFLRVRTLADEYAGVSVRIADTPVPAKKLMRLLAAESSDAPRCAAAWTRGAGSTAASDTMRTAAALRVITVLGDMRQVAPMTLVSGSFPLDSDMDGCLLDIESAQALFHSVNVEGASLSLDGRRYAVRGVVEGGEPMMLVRGDGETRYENLELIVPDLAAGGADAEAFLYRHALTSDYVIVQSGLYVRILRGLLFLPAALLLLAAAVRLCAAALRKRERTLPRSAALLLFALLCAAVMVLLLRRTFFWPQVFLPTKCADFAFWGALADGWRNAWTAIRLTAPLPKELVFFREMRACLWRIAAILLLGIGYMAGSGPAYDRTGAPKGEYR